MGLGTFFKRFSKEAKSDYSQIAQSRLNNIANEQGGLAKVARTRLSDDERFDSVLRANLHPKMYDFLRDRDVTYHTVDGLSHYGVGGLYSPGSRQVFMDSTMMDPALIMHETGHAVDFEYGTAIHEKTTGETLARHRKVDHPLVGSDLDPTTTDMHGMGTGKTAIDKYVRPLSVGHPELADDWRKNKAFWSATSEAAAKHQAEMGSGEWSSEQQAAMLAEFTELDKGRYAPTPYASMNTLESFAESFRIKSNMGIPQIPGSEALYTQDRPVSDAFSAVYEKIHTSLENGELADLEMTKPDPSRGSLGMNVQDGGFFARAGDVAKNMMQRPTRGHVTRSTRNINRNGLFG